LKKYNRCLILVFRFLGATFLTNLLRKSRNDFQLHKLYGQTSSEFREMAHSSPSNILSRKGIANPHICMHAFENLSAACDMFLGCCCRFHCRCIFFPPALLTGVKIWHTHAVCPYQDVCGCGCGCVCELGHCLNCPSRLSCNI